EIKVFGRGHVVCRSTEREARERYELVHRQLADVEAARHVTLLSMANSQSTDWEAAEMQRIVEGMTAGFWAIPMVGTPDQVVQTMLDLGRAGLDGIALSFVDYDEGLRQLEADLLPRLVQAGARRAPRAAQTR